MASLSDTLVASNAPPTQGITQDMQEGMKAGIGLATAKEQVESAKVKLEDQKAELVMKQANTANSLLTNLARANPAVAKMMVKQVREKLLNLGVDPEIANYTISDDANRQRQIAFSQMAGGKLTSDKELAGEYFQNLASVVGYDQAAQQFSTELKNQQDNSKQQVANTQQTKIEQMGNDSAERIAAMNNEAKLAKQGGAGLTMGEKARDVKFAKDFSTFFDSGGAAGIEANLESIDKSLTTLEQGKTTQAEGFVPDMVGNVMFPETANVRSNVTAVLIQGLKDTFGGQLSDGERKAMVESAYVASADPKQNAARIKALSNKIKAGARAKELAGQYFEDHGTLKGFKGTDSFNIGGKTIKFKPEGGQETSGNLDINAKIKAAQDAGYSPEEIDAYVKKNVSK